MSSYQAGTASARRSAVPRIVLVLVVLAAVVGTASGLAFAFWTSSGSGTASAATGTMTAPGTVTGTSTAGTGTVSLSWTAATGVTSPEYYVTRTDSANATSPACLTSPGNTTTSTSCADSAVPVGAYTYRVVTVYRSWTATSAPSSPVTVAKASQTVSFTSTPVAPTFGGTYTVTATGGGSGNPVVFGTPTPAVCTVSGANVSFVHAGSCTLTADQAGSTYYTAATQATQSFVVAKQSQVVAFTSNAPSNAVLGGASYTPTATGGGSGNPVTFTINSPAVCSISAGVVTYQHVGTCVINANQAGTSDYLAANQVQQSIAVGQGSQAITFTSAPPSPAQVGGTYAVSATSTSGLAVVITLDATSSGCTISGSTVTFASAGTCIVDANQAGNGDYLAAAQMQQSFPITKVNQTITFTSTAPAAATFGGATYTATATATSGLAVAFTSATPTVCSSSGTNGATISFVGAGTCTVSANQAGNTTYNPAPQVQQTFAVAKASQTITFTSTAPAAATVGGATYTVSATATSGLAVTFTSATTNICTVSGSTVSFVGAGNCTVNADQAGNANYTAAPTKPQTFTVGKGSQTIAFTSTAPSGATVGGATYTVTATGGLSSSPVLFSSATTGVCTVSGSTVTFVGAGTCTINANQAGDANYNAATQQQQTFSVAPAPVATKFAVSAGASQTAGTSFSVTVTAQTSGGATATSYSGSHTITLTSNATNSPSGAAPTLPSGAVTFSSGVATITGVIMTNAETGRTITASDGSLSGTSGAIAVAVGAPAQLAWTHVTVSAGTLSPLCLFTCTDTALGNNGTFTGNVSVTDGSGNTVTNLGTGHSVTVSTPGSGAGSGGAFTLPTAGTSVALSFPATGAADSTVQFTFKGQTGSWTSDTFTAATSLGTTYTSAAATVTKQ